MRLFIERSWEIISHESFFMFSAILIEGILNKTLVGITKGQIISKANYGILISSKKRTNKFDFTTMIPHVDLFSFVFWRKLKTPKRHFEIN